MKVTDKHLIDKVINRCDEYVDGLTIFAGQGAVMISMSVHIVYASDAALGGITNLFEITIAKRNESTKAQHDYCSYEHMIDVRPIDDFELSNAVVEFYDSEREAHARIGALIAEHNGF